MGDWSWRFSDQGERVDVYHFLDGTRPEVVVMMAVDSGIEVHTAPVTFPWNVEQFDKTSICLSDVQGNKLKVCGTALLNNGVHDVSGNVIEIGTRFLVSDTVKFVLSVGELGRHGWSTTLGTMPCLSHEAGCQVPLTRKRNSFYLSARLAFNGEVEWKMVATTSTGSATPSPSGRELGSSGASGALLPPLAEALPVPMDVVPEDVPLRPVLCAWSPVAALRDGLKALNGLVHGTKDELWKWLCEYEARAEQQLRERQWIEARKNELIQGARLHEAETWDAPSKPEDPMEIERHEVTHIPPIPWCLACRLGKGRDASHFRSRAVREAAQIQIGFCFLREDAAAYDVAAPVPENPWATILCAVDVATQNPLAIAPLRHRNIDSMVHRTISAWLRHTPKNGKLLFTMDLAPLEVGYKEAQHSFLISFWPSFGSNLVSCLRRRSKRKASSATLLFTLVSLEANHATTLVAHPAAWLPIIGVF